MNKINYDSVMQKTIGELNGQKKKLLLHSCCAPCSTACIERLKDFFDITIYYYNPNIDGKKEFDLRAEEQNRLCKTLGVSLIVEEYDSSEFYSLIKGLESAVEGGARCAKCFELRLKKSALKAKEIGADYFATTLTVSPLKNAKLINEIGVIVQEIVGVKYLQTDFKKRNGYLRSIELSNEFSLYRQNYCGCEFSKKKIEEQ
jgi:predicted adenine nucleotide alpha hydrolase (AANH) superfamily ATPase